MKLCFLPGLAIVMLSGCAGLPSPASTGPPACVPLTESLCVKATDYALRVRNDWNETVTVAAWSNATSTAVLPATDVIIPTQGHANPPWTITIGAKNATIWRRTLRGAQNEVGPSNSSFPRVYWYFIDVYGYGTIITCPGGCGSG